MATAEKQPVELRPYYEQEPFLKRDKRYYGFISGVGAGKTSAGIIRAVLNAIEWNNGEMGAIVAPTTTMVRDNIISLMRKFGLIDSGLWEYNSSYSSEPGIKVDDDTRILILSGNDKRTIEHLSGLNLAWFWLDEAPRTAERAAEILLQRLRVGDYPNGFFTGTPKGFDYTHDFFAGEDVEYEEYQYGEGWVYESDDRLAITRVPTSANPYTDEEYHDQMERTHEGQVYEQEVLGKWVKYEGLVYQWFDPEKHVRPALDHNIRRLYYGVDWGHNNPAAIVAVAETTRDELWVVDVFYAKGQDYNDMVDAARMLQDEHREGRFYCDPAEPAAIDMFKRAGLDAVGAENDILPGIQYVSAQRDQLYVLDHCQSIRNEFKAYRYDTDSEKEKPAPGNDHALDALRYALFTDAQTGGRNYAMQGVDLI